MRTVVAAAIVLACAPHARAEVRRAVAVRVEVVAPSFRRELVGPGQATSPELQSAERDAARQIAAALGEPPGFLAFQAEGEPAVAGGPAPAATLTVRVVAKAPAAATVLREIGLVVDAAGAGVGRGEPAYLVLRGQDDIRAAPSRAAELAREIASRVAEREEDVVRDVLSRVPIATTGARLEEPLGWILPYRPEEICIDFRSRFAIASEVQQAIGRQELDLPSEFRVVFDPPGDTPLDDHRHRIVTLPTLPGDHPDIVLLKGARAATVKAVRVTQYVRQSGCGAQPSPAEAFR